MGSWDALFVTDGVILLVTSFCVLFRPFGWIDKKQDLGLLKSIVNPLFSLAMLCALVVGQDDADSRKVVASMVLIPQHAATFAVLITRVATNQSLIGLSPFRSEPEPKPKRFAIAMAFMHLVLGAGCVIHSITYATNVNYLLLTFGGSLLLVVWHTSVHRDDQPFCYAYVSRTRIRRIRATDDEFSTNQRERSRTLVLATPPSHEEGTADPPSAMEILTSSKLKQIKEDIRPFGVLSDPGRIRGEGTAQSMPHGPCSQPDGRSMVATTMAKAAPIVDHDHVSLAPDEEELYSPRVIVTPPSESPVLDQAATPEGSNRVGMRYAVLASARRLPRRLSPKQPSRSARVLPRPGFKHTVGPLFKNITPAMVQRTKTTTTQRVVYVNQPLPSMDVPIPTPALSTTPSGTRGDAAAAPA